MTEAAAPLMPDRHPEAVCAGARAICMHPGQPPTDHACLGCHVRAAHVLNAAGPLLTAAQDERIADLTRQLRGTSTDRLYGGVELLARVEERGHSAFDQILWDEHCQVLTFRAAGGVDFVSLWLENHTGPDDTHRDADTVDGNNRPGGRSPYLVWERW